MKWSSAVSGSPELRRAADETIERVRAELAGARPDLVFAFVSTEHRASWGGLPELLGAAFEGAVVMGCSAESVIGAGRELERGPGLSLTAAVLPGATLRPFRVDGATLPDDRLGPELFPASAHEHAAFVLLADPFTAQTGPLIECLDRGFPHSVKVGGLASGGRQPGENALFVGGTLQPFGLVGVAIEGGVKVDPVVAQGCRPIGQPMFVTRARDNLLLELDGQSPLRQLQDLLESLAPEEQALARGSLFIGLVMREGQVEYRQGDFLVRNLVGVDDESGAIAVAAELDNARVVQFHLRDARTSADDLNACLARYKRTERDSSPEGALLFSCLGRGRQLYGEPDHDSRVFREQLGPLPLGGFFCNGEIGPVQDRTHLHGYTSCFAIFRAAAG